MEFEWDPDKGIRNLVKHGVAFTDAATVFGDPLATTFADPDHADDEDRFITFGRSTGRSAPDCRSYRPRGSDPDHQCPASEPRGKENL